MHPHLCPFLGVGNSVCKGHETSSWYMRTLRFPAATLLTVFYQIKLGPTAVSGRLLDLKSILCLTLRWSLSIRPEVLGLSRRTSKQPPGPWGTAAQGWPLELTLQGLLTPRQARFVVTRIYLSCSRSEKFVTETAAAGFTHVSLSYWNHLISF